MALKKTMGRATLVARAPAARFSHAEFKAADLRYIPPPHPDYPQGYYKFGWQTLAVGEATKLHTGIQAEFYIFIRGRGKMELVGEVFPVQEDDVIYLPPTSARSVTNDSDAVLEYLWMGVPFIV
jgi:mannose-6-phosphate isomerase-like protein (cupin superfamily)